MAKLSFSLLPCLYFIVFLAVACLHATAETHKQLRTTAEEVVGTRLSSKTFPQNSFKKIHGITWVSAKIRKLKQTTDEEDLATNEVFEDFATTAVDYQTSDDDMSSADEENSATGEERVSTFEDYRTTTDDYMSTTDGEELVSTTEDGRTTDDQISITDEELVSTAEDDRTTYDQMATNSVEENFVASEELDSTTADHRTSDEHMTTSTEENVSSTDETMSDTRSNEETDSDEEGLSKGWVIYEEQLQPVTDTLCERAEISCDQTMHKKKGACRFEEYCRCYYVEGLFANCLLKSTYKKYSS